MTQVYLLFDHKLTGTYITRTKTSHKTDQN